MYRTIDRLSDLSERVPYKNAEFPVLANRSWVSTYRNMEAACHWHDDLEFAVALSGHMTYSVNGQMLRLEAGQGIFINSRQLHSNFSADGVDCEYVVVLVHPSLLCANEYVAEHCVRPLAQNAAFPFALLSQDVVWRNEAMEAILRAQRAHAGGEPALDVLAHAHRLAALLLANMPPEDGRAPRVDPRLSALRAMVGFVQRHYAERILLSDIAAAGGMSRGACCQLFRRHVGRTPGEYLSRYRIEKAMGLLSQPDLTVTEVALAVGFSGSSYFAESFRKELGISPTEYRRRA